MFELANIAYAMDEDYNDFYTRFRTAVCRNLKRAGTRIQYLNETELLEDEVLSPTFEDVIIVWCLDKIDNSLPMSANEAFRHKLTSDLTLKDLREEIFASIPDLLALVTETESHEIGTDGHDVKDEDVDHGYDVLGEAKDDEVLKADEESDEHMFPEIDLNFDQFEGDRPRNEDVVWNLEDDQIQCSICMKTFSTKKKLWDHARIHRLEKSVCKLCDKVFKCRKALVDHTSKRHRITYTCSTCQAVLVGQFRYIKHVKLKHPDEYEEDAIVKAAEADGLICPICKKQEASSVKLTMHIKSHHQPQINNSDENGDEGAEISVTEADKKETENVKAMPNSETICDICAKSVKSKYMKQHKKTHGIENQTCGQCDKRFQDRQEYLRHMRSHRSIVKKASCEECGQTFTQVAHLKKHRKIHAVGEKLQCDTCKRSFFSKKEMGAHVCKHHACDVCGEKYMRRRNLEMHKRIHFGETVFSCDLCESVFLTKKRMNEHVNYQHKREKKNKCPVCGKAFLMKSGLAQHLLVHTGEKPFSCSQCGLGFTQKGNMEIHLRLHSNEFPFKCSVCDSKFRQAGDLKRHRETKMCGFTQADLFQSEEQAVL